MAARHFRLDYTARATRQAAALIDRADRCHRGDEQILILARIVGALRNDPLSFGEPKYNTRRPGGVVCQGVQENVWVQFAVYEQDRVVIVLDFKPMDESDGD